MELKSVLKRWAQEDAGQDLIEYALLCAFIVLVSVPTLISLNASIATAFGVGADRLEEAAAP